MTMDSTVFCDGCKEKIESYHSIHLFESGGWGKSYFGGEVKPLKGLDFCNIKCLDIWIKSITTNGK